MTESVLRAVRRALLIAAPAVLLIVLVPAGSAKPTPVTKFEICVQNAGTPSCTGTVSSSFTGNTASTVQLSVLNDGTSSLSIGSADVTVPPQLLVVQGSAQPSANVTTAGQHVKFQNIKINPGKSFTATFTADVACGGTFNWPTPAAYNSTDLSGAGFATYAATASATTSIVTECHLAFVNQPTDTVSGQPIADQGASTGDPVTVGLFDNNGAPMTSCPIGYSTCSVDVDSSPAGVNAETQQLDSGLVASFADLSITIPAADVADQFNLVASGHGSFAPQVTSSSFLIAHTVSPLSCSGNSCTSNGHKQLSGTNLADSFADVTSSNGFTFMTLSPFTLVNAPVHAGCQGLAPLNVTGFAESDGRQPGSGTLTIRYYVNKDILTARYGRNVGNQFAPMCVGGRPVDTATGTIHDCNEQGPWNTGGWLGDAITSSGKFTGGTARAVCDSDGYYWGIISSYQDKLDATTNPVVSNWGGTQIGGANFRFFDMSIPPNWDWRSGP